MVHATATTQLEATVDAAWTVLIDFERYAEWLALHQEWVGDLPSSAAAGAGFSEKVGIIGAPAVVDWTIREYGAPQRLELAGTTNVGVELQLAYALAPAGDGSALTIDLELTGGPVDGPFGEVIRDAAQGLVGASAEKFAALV